MGLGEWLKGAWEWVTGRSDQDKAVYANYDKVADVTDNIRTIAKKTVGDAQDEIYTAFNSLNAVNGFQDYVGTVNVSKYDTVFEAISQTIEGVADAIDGKAEAIKDYEESPWYAKLASSFTMGLTKTLEGGLSFFEELGDGALSVIGWAGGLFGAEDFKQGCAEIIKKDWSHDLFNFYYDSKFSHASWFTEESGASQAFALSGKVFSMVTAGAFGGAGLVQIPMAAMGRGTEAGLQAGLSYEDSMKVGLKTAAIATVTSTLVPGGPWTRAAGAAIAEEIIANKTQENAVPEIERAYREGEEDRFTGKEVEQVGKQELRKIPQDDPTPDTDPGHDDKYDYTPSTSGDGGGYKPLETIDTDPPTKDTDPPAKETDPPAKETDPPKTDTDPPAKETDPPARETDPPRRDTDPPYYRIEQKTDPPHSIYSYDGENFETDDELENATGLEELDDLGIASSIDDIIKGNKFKKIPTSKKPINANKDSGSSSVVPIAAGLTAAAAAGLGAKAYMDYKKNNEEDEDEDYDEEYSDDDFESEEWSENPDDIKVEEASTEEGLEEDNFYQDPEDSYTARDSLSEL